MAAKWTDEQKLAMNLRNRNILVSAAAGSGKTAVLVERIFKMLTEGTHPLDIDQLLVVTFTNAAAAEMKERVQDRLNQCLEEDPDNVHVQQQIAAMHTAKIMTIHSFCLHVIRNYFNVIDLDPSFRIGDETELKILKQDVAQELLEEYYGKEDPVFLDFVECFSVGKMDGGLEDLLIQVYEFSRSYPWPDAWLDSCLAIFKCKDVNELLEHDVMQFMSQYISQMAEELCVTMEKAKTLCLEDDGPIAYLDNICEELNCLNRLKDASDLDACYKIMQTFEFRALSRKKMPNASEDKKNQVKVLRDFVKKTINDMKESFMSVDMATSLDYLHVMCPVMEKLVELVKAFAQSFADAKEEKNMVDFGDLEHFALKILIDKEAENVVPTPVAKVFRNQFAEILVDEYQDSNQVQETILTSISKIDDGHPNMFMVGDVKQSIYKFRLAKPELFMHKYDTYSLEEDLYQRVDLHMNFRSRDVVLQTVNFLFDKFMAKDLGQIAYDKDAALYVGASFPKTDLHVAAEGEMLLLEGSDEGEDKALEARMIAHRIHELVDGDDPLFVLDKETETYRKVRYGDIVILLRTISGWSDIFVRELGMEGISAQAETAAGFFSVTEVRTIMAYLAIVDNPMQDIALAAVLHSPIGGFDDEALAMIRSIDKKGLLYESCKAFLNPDSDMFLEMHYDMDAVLKVRQQLSLFLEQLNALRDQISFLSIHELLLEIFDQTGYYRYAGAMPGGERRQANLDMLVEKAVAYENTSYQGLFNFIRYMDKLKKYEIDFGEAMISDNVVDTVRIMSIHKSKGLEFPVVFVSGLGKSFNHQDAREGLVIHSELGFGPDYIDSNLRIKTPTVVKKLLSKKMVLENLGEELRVLYVALTRAKEKLIMTGCVKDLEKALDKWTAFSGLGASQLTFLEKIQAGSFLDWIMAVLVCHRSAHQLLEHYDKISPIFNPYYDDPTAIDVLFFTAEDLARRTLEKGTKDLLTKLSLEHWDASQVYEPQMREMMENLLLWQYPFLNETVERTKLSVSEIKHMHQLELEEEQFVSDQPIAETENDPLSKEERMANAALRGTTVHRILELMDIHKIESVADVQVLADAYVEQGFITKEGRDMIYEPGIYKFAKSKIARRMADALANGKLYREQQFVMGVPGENNDPDNLLLIQGIIDAWFVEDGQAVIVDYKTDYVSDDGASLIAKYKVQLEYYAKAVEQITGIKVKEKIIYSLGLGKELKV